MSSTVPISSSGLSADQEADLIFLTEFLRNLVIAKGVDFDSLTDEMKIRKSQEILSIYLDFIEQSIEIVGNEDQKKHWRMYKASNLSPKLLESLDTLKPMIDALTEEFLKL